MNDYAARDKILRQLGFADYREYLGSIVWFRIRRRVFRARGKACCSCGGRATQVHHANYALETLRGDDEHLRFLHPVCDLCHSAAEKTGNYKVPLVVANQRLGLLGVSMGPCSHTDTRDDFGKTKKQRRRAWQQFRKLTEHGRDAVPPPFPDPGSRKKAKKTHPQRWSLPKLRRINSAMDAMRNAGRMSQPN